MLYRREVSSASSWAAVSFAEHYVELTKKGVSPVVIRDQTYILGLEYSASIWD